MSDAQLQQQSIPGPARPQPILSNWNQLVTEVNVKHFREFGPQHHVPFGKPHES